MNMIDLDALQSVRTYPCVSVLLGTGPGSALAPADRDRLDALLDEAARRLRRELPKERTDALVRRLADLAGVAARQPQAQGLALFVSDDVEWASTLAVRPRDRVVVDDTFATRDLVEHVNRTDPYWMLTVSEQVARVFLGNVDRLVELDDGRFPLDVSMVDGGDRVTTEEFLRAVSAALDDELDGDSVPLVVAGVERTVTAFLRLSGRQAVGRVGGNHDRTPAGELHRLGWPVMAKVLDARQSVALGDLDRARGQRRFASGVREIWSLAHEGRVAHVVAERTYEVPARLGADPEDVRPAEDREAPDVVDDLVDDLVELVLAKGGAATFVDDGVLGEHGRVAAVLRY